MIRVNWRLFCATICYQARAAGWAKRTHHRCRMMGTSLRSFAHLTEELLQPDQGGHAAGGFVAAVGKEILRF